MPLDKFFIGPLDKGEQGNVKPWLIMDTAFESLRNVYTWRGSVKKRPGGRVMNQTVSLLQQALLTRLRINIGVTIGGGVPTILNIPNSAAVNKLAPGQLFSVGDDMFTITAIGAGVVITVATTSVYTATVDTGVNPNTVTFSGTAPIGSTVWWYPAFPVQHFATLDTSAINDEGLIAFDTNFPYTFTYATGWNWLVGGGGNNTWNGTNATFYSHANWQTTPQTFRIFVTNNLVADAMRYWDGANWNAFGTVGTTQINAAGDFLVTCSIIRVFKGRLLCFNVTENIAAANTVFVNRVRYSQVGDPTAANAWRQDIPGRGSFEDVPVKEVISAVEYVKDRLIVFCENSTWELAYTGNELDPFVFQQINTELGVESINSIIPFNQYAVGFGNVGIHQCNGITVERIDELIPNEVFEVSNDNSGNLRVTGIRDYFLESIYWSYQATSFNTGLNNVFPNKVLYYNYRNESWASFEDSITAFGNFQLSQTLRWTDVQTVWSQFSPRWQDAELQDRFRAVIAGNQEGFTFIFDSRKTSNSVSLQITNIGISSVTVTFTVYNHNLSQNGYVFFTGIQDDGGTLATGLNNKIFQVRTLTADTFSVQTTAVLTGMYLGGGNVTRVSEIAIFTKQYNFYNQPGMEIALEHVDFLVDNVKDRTDEEDFVPAQITVDAYLSTSNISSIQDAENTLSNFGTNILELSPYAAVTFEQQQKQFWHRVYYNQTGEFVQLVFTETPDQILDPEYVFTDFQLNAMLFYVKPTKTLGY